MDVSRRGFMQCMAWAGTGVLWTMAGGVLSSCSVADQGASGDGAFSFAQISDTHVGFGGPANPNAMATLAESIARINATPTPPDLRWSACLLLHRRLVLAGWCRSPSRYSAH